MSEDIDILIGTVDNGRRTTAAFPFYTGPVGVRAIGDRLELAYFDPRAWQVPALPAIGAIGDQPCVAIEVRRPRTKGAAVIVIAEAIDQS